MNAGTIVYVLAMIGAAAVLFSLAYYAWSRPRRTVTTSYSAMALTQGCWALCVAALPFGSTLSQKMPVEGLTWLFSFAFVVSLLHFTLAYTRKSIPRPRLIWTAITVPFIAVVLLVFSNDYHHLMFSRVEVVSNGLFSQIQEEYTPATFAVFGYGYLLALVAIGLLFRHRADSSGAFRTRTSIVILGVVIPPAVELFGIVASTGISPPQLNIGFAIVYATSTVLIALGIFRFRLLAFIPIARELVIDTMSDAVIVVDEEVTVVDCNRAGYAFADPASPRPIGRPLADAFPRWVDAFRGFWDTGDIDTRIASDVSDRHFDLKIRSINDEQGNRLGRLAVIRDVTEQVRLQEIKLHEETLNTALEKQRELSHLKTRMMIRIAHEFRTPLATISLNDQMLEKYYSRMSREQRAEKFDETRQQVRHLTEVLDDIAMIVKNGTQGVELSLSAFNVADLCRECADEQRTSQGADRSITVTTEMPERRIHADRRAVSGILRNLLTNAVMYSPVGSPIELEQRLDGGSLVLRLTDAGIGIPVDDLNHIFEPFFRGQNTEDTPGFGLGLSVVRDYVNAHGGEISVYSRLGEGTTFTVRLAVVILTDATTDDNGSGEISASLPRP